MPGFRSCILLYGCRLESEWQEITERIYQEILRLELIGNCYNEKSELAYMGEVLSTALFAATDEQRTLLLEALEPLIIDCKFDFNN